MGEFKSYTQPPLPFRGNKRMWVKQFTELLKANYSDCDIVVDLFGGSGFCSYLAKKALPNAEVVYNDFDYYVNRIRKIPQTNEIIRRLSQVIAGIPIKANIGKEKKKECLDIIREYDATGYLDGLTITHVDWRELYERYKDCGKKVLFLFDPPYMNTEATGYRNTEYSDLKQNINLLKVIFDICKKEGCNFVLFTSDKSGFIELLDFIGEIQNCKTYHNYLFRSNFINYQNKYIDYLIYKVA